MDPQTLFTGLLTVAVGAVSGGITNAVAIWMLFHPYEPRGVGRFRLHGAMPKNKARLAKSIGRTVGEKLLTPEDLSRRLAAPEIREAFHGAFDRILTDLLEAERGPLRNQLAPGLAASLDEALEVVGRRVAEQLKGYAETPEFTRTVADWLARLQDDLGPRPIAEVLTPERRASLRRTVDGWVGQLAEGDKLEGVLRGFVDDRLAELARDDRPLLDRLPAGLVGAVEQGITDYLPVAIERIAGVLADPEAKSRIQRGLREAFDGSVRDMLIHERLIAKLVVTDKTFARLLDGFERDGFERFAEALNAPEMRAQMTRAVNDAVVQFLRVPLGERLARLGPERRQALAGTLGDWLVRVARDEATRSVIADTVDRALGAAERRTWGELLGVIPPERAAGLAARALTDPRGQRWIGDTVRTLAEKLLSQPLGRPVNWLGAETTARLKAGAVEAAWSWTQHQIPQVVTQFRIEEMVEQKVLGFSTQRMEEIVRGVTQRELTLIVRLGYVLGGLVGLLAFGINQLVG